MRAFITKEEAELKLGLTENPMLDIYVDAANSIIDNYVDDTILETNSLAKLGALKYVDFMNTKKSGIKSITDVDMTIVYDTPSAGNLPTFIAELLAPIKKQLQATSGTCMFL